MTVGTWEMVLDNSCFGGSNVYTYDTITFNSNGTTSGDWGGSLWSMCGSTLTISNLSGSYEITGTYSNGVITGYYYNNGTASYCATLTPNGGGTTYGCTDPIACNYDVSAIIDDSSCIYISFPAVDMTVGTWEMVLDNSCFGGSNVYTYDTITFNSNGTTSGDWGGSLWSMCGSTLTISNLSGSYEITGTYSNGVITGYYYNNGTASYCATLTPNGGSSTSCSQSNTTTNPATAYAVYGTNYGATDLIVNSGEDFELTIVSPELWINGGGTFSSVTLSYYADNNGSPGTLIGTETVTPSNQTLIGTWSGGSSWYRYEVTLNVTPFTFTGQTNTNTTYWIGINNVTETNNQLAYWGVDNALGGNYYGYISNGGSSWSGLSDDFVYEFSGNSVFDRRKRLWLH
jgi:hypothetical protein